jgi:hypothetical protein
MNSSLHSDDVLNPTPLVSTDVQYTQLRHRVSMATTNRLTLFILGTVRNIVCCQNTQLLGVKQVVPLRFNVPIN